MVVFCVVFTVVVVAFVVVVTRSVRSVCGGSSSGGSSGGGSSRRSGGIIIDLLLLVLCDSPKLELMGAVVVSEPLASGGIMIACFLVVVVFSADAPVSSGTVVVCDGKKHDVAVFCKNFAVS